MDHLSWPRHIFILNMYLMVQLSPHLAGTANADTTLLPESTARDLACADDQECTLLHYRWRSFSAINMRLLATKSVVADDVRLQYFNSDLSEVSPTDVVLFERTERLAAFDLFGRLAPDLHAILSENADFPDMPVPVAIWLRSETPPLLTKEHLNDSESYLALQSWRDSLLAVQETFRNKARLIGLGEVQCLQDVPVCKLIANADAIFSLNSVSEVGTVFYDRPLEPGSTTWKDTCRVSSLTAPAIWVGVSEVFRPDSTALLPGIVATHEPTWPTGPHARLVLGVIYQSIHPYGIARYSSNFVGNTSNGVVSPWEPVQTWFSQFSPPVRVRNDSNHHDEGTNGDITHADWFIDFIVKNPPYPTYVRLAGNNNPNAYVDGKDFNAISVGATNDAGTTTRSDDFMAGFSSRRNPISAHGDREKPEICAPGEGLTVAGAQNVSGTSFSSPMVAGAAAVLMHGQLDLLNWPEAVRAVLMAGADEDVDGTLLNLSDAVDDSDGAGEVCVLCSSDVASILQITSNSPTGGEPSSLRGYHRATVNFQNNFPSGTYDTPIYVGGPFVGTRLRAVLAWDSTAVCADSEDEYSCTGDQLDADLDLLVYRHPQNTLVAWSSTYDNSFEFVDFPAESNQMYVLRVRRYLPTAQPGTYLALAWRIYAS